MNGFRTPSIPNSEWVVLLLAVCGGLLALLAVCSLVKLFSTSSEAASGEGKENQLDRG
jgi:hypothetical protein